MSQLPNTQLIQANLSGSRLSYADLSHAQVQQAVITGCELTRCNLHNIQEEDTDWAGSNKPDALPTDEKRLKAERWKKPPARA